MAAFSALLSHSSVLGHPNANGNPMLSFRYPKAPDMVKCKFVPKWTQSFQVERVRPRFAMSREGSYGGMKFDDEYDQDPLWLELCKETIRSLKSLFAFLVEQPGQLKHLEWPTFQDTLRTATLALVLVAMLIVALSSIDSALSYVLAILMRRPA